MREKSEDGIIATTASGRVEGLVEGDAAVYRGIPFAAPPIGELRWRPPQPAPPWTDVLKAHRFGPICPQHDLPITPFTIGDMSEDCLTLNVWGPRDMKASNLPVMVWISGGAFIAGAGSWPVYDGTRYVERGVIVVTLNYRVGRFGFFAHPILSAESPNEPLANYGLMDVIAALRWVQANIAAFGGDPRQVTLAGHSAAGLMIAALMGSQTASGLFAKAIVMSASSLTRPRRPMRLDDPEQPNYYEADAETDGVRFTDSLERPVATAAELRALPADVVLGPPAATGELPPRALMLDGQIITEETLVPFCSGAAANIPLIIGTTNRDLHCWIVKDPANPQNLFPCDYWIEYPLAVQSPGNLQSELGDRLNEYAAVVTRTSDDDWNEVLQLDILDAAVRLAAEQMNHSGAKAFVYRFTAVPGRLRARSRGVPHAGELSFVFDSFSKMSEVAAFGASPEDSELSSVLIDYWTSFVKTGDPNGPGRPQWPVYAGYGDVLEFAAEGPLIRETLPAERLASATRLISSRLDLLSLNDIAAE